MNRENINISTAEHQISDVEDKIVAEPKKS